MVDMHSVADQERGPATEYKGADGLDMKPR